MPRIRTRSDLLRSRVSAAVPSVQASPIIVREGPSDSAIRERDAIISSLLRELQRANNQVSTSSTPSGATEAIKHAYGIQEKLLDQKLYFDREAFKAEQTAEERLINNRLKQLQTLKAVKELQKPSEPGKIELELLRSRLRQIEETKKQKQRIDLEQFKAQKLDERTLLRHRQSVELEGIKAALKPKKQPTLTRAEKFQNQLRHGSIQSARDIASFYANEGYSGEKLRDMVEITSGSLGMDTSSMRQLPGFFGPSQAETTPELREAFVNWLDTPVPVAGVSSELTAAIRSFGSRASYESYIINHSASRIENGADPAREKAAAQQMMNAAAKVFPDQPRANAADIFDLQELMDRATEREAIERRRQELQSVQDELKLRKENTNGLSSESLGVLESWMEQGITPKQALGLLRTLPPKAQKELNEWLNPGTETKGNNNAR